RIDSGTYVVQEIWRGQRSTSYPPSERLARFNHENGPSLPRERDRGCEAIWTRAYDHSIVRNVLRHLASAAEAFCEEEYARAIAVREARAPDRSQIASVCKNATPHVAMGNASSLLSMAGASHGYDVCILSPYDQAKEAKGKRGAAPRASGGAV